LFNLSFSDKVNPMSATRPSSVPPNATEVYPNGGGTPPGYDPQLAAVQQFESTVAYLNRQAMRNYAGAYMDWQANKGQDEAYGLPVPPAPVAPVLRVANAVWANTAGTPNTVRQPGDFAWIWES
jgi:hypothetical protein